MAVSKKSFDKPRRALIKFWLRFRVAVVALVVVGLVVAGGLYAWQSWQQGEKQSREQIARETASRASKSVRDAVAGLLGAVDARLNGDELLDALESGSPDDLRASERALADSNGDVLGVRVFAEPPRAPDYGATPPVTYASIEMMRNALETGKSPAPEVLLLGEEEEHVAMVRPLTRAGDAEVRGVVLFGLDVKPLAASLKNAGLQGGYAELIQAGGAGRVVVSQSGRAEAKQGIPTVSLPVVGSNLRVQYWHGPDSREADVPVIPLAAGAAALLIVLGGLWFLRRRKKPSESIPVSPEIAEAPALNEKLAALRQTGQDQPPLPPALEVSYEEEESPVPGEDESDVSSEKEPPVLDVIFRAYDIRGVVGESLTLEVVKQIGLAIGSEAYERGQQTLCVGCDGRASSPDLVAALVEGLRESGRDVIDVGRVPTPVLYFATYYLETGSGVMVTGSHNPPEYNGLKMMLGGDTLFGDDIQALKARIEKQDFTSGAGNLRTMDVGADYIRRVSEDVPVALGNVLKVVIDCGNGVAGDFAPKLVKALGHDVVELYCEVDGSFPNHHPDPSQPENLEDLIAKVKETDADIGFAFDGDGDRLGIVDGSGHILWPDSQMMLFARDVLSRNPGAEIVFDVKCSSRLAQVISSLGGKPVMFKTGHSFIKNKLKETGAPLAGEMSGHIFFKERWYGFDDALYAAARMLEILMGFKQKPQEVFAKLPVGVSTPELRVDMDEGQNLAFMESLSDTSQFGDAQVTTIDGVRVDWKDRWGLVRASNTTPSLVLRFEGDDEQALERVKETFRKLLLEKKPDLTLPF